MYRRNEQLFNVIICNIFSVKTLRIYLKKIPQQHEVKYDIRFKIINNIIYYIVLGFLYNV